MNKPTLYIEETDTEKELPSKWRICGQCEGVGTSSAYLGAYTWDEMEDAGEEFIEDYFAGNFDKQCDNCGGTGKILEVDFARMTPEETKLFRAQEYERGSMERENAMERRMGA